MREIEPKPKLLEEEIIEKYPDFDVYLFWWHGGYWRLQGLGTYCPFPQDCLFAKGFYRFVYEESGLFTLSRSCIEFNEDTEELPVAALFKKEKVR